jgi:hypothetical protein
MARAGAKANSLNQSRPRCKPSGGKLPHPSRRIVASPSSVRTILLPSDLRVYQRCHRPGPWCRAEPGEGGIIGRADLIRRGPVGQRWEGGGLREELEPVLGASHHERRNHPTDLERPKGAASLVNS